MNAATASSLNIDRLVFRFAGLFVLISLALVGLTLLVGGRREAAA